MGGGVSLQTTQDKISGRENSPEEYGSNSRQFFSLIQKFKPTILQTKGRQPLTLVPALHARWWMMAGEVVSGKKKKRGYLEEKIQVIIPLVLTSI